MTIALGLATGLQQAMLASAVNGVGLALVIPSVQSVVADCTTPDQRGRAFGTMGLTSSLGGMAGAFLATNAGARSFWGMQGWRFAFHVVGLVSLATAAAVAQLAVDPRRRGGTVPRDDLELTPADTADSAGGPLSPRVKPRKTGAAETPDPAPAQAQAPLASSPDRHPLLPRCRWECMVEGWGVAGYACACVWGWGGEWGGQGCRVDRSKISCLEPTPGAACSRSQRGC